MRWLAFLLLLVFLLGFGWLASRTAPPASDEDPVGRSAQPADPSGASLPVTAIPEPEDTRIAQETSTGDASGTPRNEAARTGAPDDPEPFEPGGLIVRVVDSEGQPAAGIPVALFMRVTGAGSDDRGRTTSRAPDGLARIELKDLDQLRKQATAIKMKIEFFVQAGVACPSPVEVPLDSWPKDGDEVELRLPPTGSIVVHAEHADGRPVTEQLSLGWWWLPADVAAANPDEGYERVKDHFAKGQDGSVRVDGIGLGLALHLQASVTGFQAAHRHGVLGPTQPGEVREFHVTLGEPFGNARVRVLDVSGSPLRSSKLWAQQWNDPDRERHPASGPPRASGYSVKTDEGGYASIMLLPGTFDIERRIDLTRSRSGHQDWSMGSTWLPKTVLPGETTELDAVRLVGPRVLCEGTVVDESGAPVPKASLRFEARYGSTPKHGWHFLFRIKGEKDGHFTLKDLRAPPSFRVVAHAEGYKSFASAPIEFGDRALLIELERASTEPQTGGIKVQVQLDDDVPSIRCMLKFKNKRGRGRSPDWWAGFPMTVDHLSPGTYDVYVETRDGDFELGRVSGVEVKAGEVSEDPRLTPFDLRGTAHTVTFQVERPDGNPWRRMRLNIQADGAGRAFDAQTNDRGVVSVILPKSVSTIRAAIHRGDVQSVTIPSTPEGPIGIVFAEE